MARTNEATSSGNASNGSGNSLLPRERHEPKAGRDEHNTRIRRDLFREIEEAQDAAEAGNAFRKLTVEIDISAGRFETGAVTSRKTLK